MKHIDFWCLDCPTRVRITTSSEELLRFRTNCPACPSTMWNTKTIMNNGYTRYDGKDFFLHEHAENEVEMLHEEFRRFNAEGDRKEAEDEYKRSVTEAKRKLEARKGPRR